MNKVLPIATIILLTLSYTIAGLTAIQAHSNPVEMDTVAYLQTALEIRDTGGILKHIPNCLTGVYTQATQHPLYLLLLSPWAEASFDFFVQAKLLTFIIGGVFLAVFFMITRHFAGWMAATAVTTLVIFNATFLRITTVVACESLMALCFILFWFFTVKGFQVHRYWIWAGVFAGLTFMTKSLGILTLPIYMLAAVWRYRHQGTRLLRNKHFWMFFLMFVLVSSPLLARNLVVYHTPLHSNSRAVMWIDEWSEYSAERAESGEIGFMRYVDTHTAKDMAKTLWTGLTDRNPRMLSDGLKPLRFWGPVDLTTLQGFHQKTVSWQGRWALAVILLALWGLIRFRHTPHVTVSVFSFAFFLIFVGWYSKVFHSTPPTRLVYCILFLILFYAVLGVREILRGRILPSVPGVLACLLIMTTLLGINGSWKDKSPLKSYAVNQIFRIQHMWVTKFVKPTESILVGDTFASYKFYFQDSLPMKINTWPVVDSMDEMIRYVKEYDIDYGLLDLATVFYQRQVFGPYFKFPPVKGLQPIKVLPDIFQHIPKDPNIPPLFEIYKIT